MNKKIKSKQRNISIVYLIFYVLTLLTTASLFIYANFRQYINTHWINSNSEEDFSLLEEEYFDFVVEEGQSLLKIHIDEWMSSGEHFFSGDDSSFLGYQVNNYAKWINTSDLSSGSLQESCNNKGLQYESSIFEPNENGVYQKYFIDYRGKSIVTDELDNYVNDSIIIADELEVHGKLIIEDSLIVVNEFSDKLWESDILVKNSWIYSKDVFDDIPSTLSIHNSLIGLTNSSYNDGNLLKKNKYIDKTSGSYVDVI